MHLHSPPRIIGGRFREGKKVRCRVLPSSSKKGAPGNSPGTNPSLKPVVELSLRASRLDSAVNVEKAIEGKEAPAVGSVVKVRYLHSRFYSTLRRMGDDSSCVRQNGI